MLTLLFVLFAQSQSVFINQREQVRLDKACSDAQLKSISEDCSRVIKMAQQDTPACGDIDYAHLLRCNIAAREILTKCTKKVNCSNTITPSDCTATAAHSDKARYKWIELTIGTCKTVADTLLARVYETCTGKPFSAKDVDKACAQNYVQGHFNLYRYCDGTAPYTSDKLIDRKPSLCTVVRHRS